MASSETLYFSIDEPSLQDRKKLYGSCKKKSVATASCHNISYSQVVFLFSINSSSRRITMSLTIVEEPSASGTEGQSRIDIEVCRRLV